MSSFIQAVPQDDILRCHSLLPMSVWRRLAGRRIFMTGGTGFVGKWLIATLLDANYRLDLDCKLTVLTRDPTLFRSSCPDLAERVHLIQGDVREFDLPNAKFDTIIHAATDVVAQNSPQITFDTCIDGTRRVIALAQRCMASDLLMISSGAVYGRTPSTMTHISEDCACAPDPTLVTSAYGEGKRAAEWLACAAASETLHVKIARCFAFVGPHLPLDKHFAVGNFLGACLKREAIVIKGDGTPFRSYLYAADMAAWLWAVLLSGRSGEAYNIGAEESLSITDLAHRITEVIGVTLPVQVLKDSSNGHQPSHYVPDTNKARTELGLPLQLPLHDAILRTVRWHQRSQHA